MSYVMAVDVFRCFLVLCLVSKKKYLKIKVDLFHMVQLDYTLGHIHKN